MKNVIILKLSGAVSAQNAYGLKSGDETAQRLPTDRPHIWAKLLNMMFWLRYEILWV